MNNIEVTSSIFESIKRIDESGSEYWCARELQEVLEYTEWRKFEGVIKKAMDACINSNYEVFEHFVDADKLSKRHNNAEILIKDYKLSRYACYLIAQNADSRKKVVALAQTYFAFQTRKQELFEEEYSKLSEDEKKILSKKSN